MSAARNGGRLAADQPAEATELVAPEPTEDVPAEDVFIEHVDQQYNHEFLSEHTVTAKQANDAWGEDFGVTFTKPMRWNKANKWRIPAADFSQDQIDALLSDPQFREKRVPRKN